MLGFVQATTRRAILRLLAVFVIAAMVLEVLTIGAASHALDPTLPWPLTPHW